MDQNEEKTFGMLCHLLSFAGILGIPFGNILGPLVIWMIKRDQSEFVNACGKESLNFQISLTIYAVICAALTLIFIGFIGLFILLIIDIVCVVKACMAAQKGEFYRYPITIRILN